jgi:hypothetical protein
MDIIDKYTYGTLTIKERAESNFSLPEDLYIDDIADLWYPDNGDLRLAVMKAITKAYLKGDLAGIEQERPRLTYEIYDFKVGISVPLHYMFSGIKYNLLINVFDFVKWLELNNYKQRKFQKCFLANWLNLTVLKENGHPPNMIRRKRKPMRKARSNLLILVDNLLSHYEIEYYDELSKKEAWRRIISGEYKDLEIIYTIGELKKSIIIGGKIIKETDFSEQFRKRFETENEAIAAINR